MLHIVTSPAALHEALIYAQSSDAVLLIADAVYAANVQHKDYPGRVELPLYALSADAQARGIEPLISPLVAKVDYSGFVDLTVQHSHSMTWD